MKVIIIKLLLGLLGVGLIGVAFGIAEAGSWDNFKLQYFSLTRLFQDQSKELDDLRARDIEPERHTRIDLRDLRDGGPPKDGIPSIDAPFFDTAATTPFDLAETVVGVVINGEAKAYPYGILNWHEIVNDVVGGIPVSISYCPLCDTILAFKRGQTTFGVSGKLFQSCLVMFDRADDSLFVQPWGIGVVGPQVNRSLQRIPAIKTTLGAWLSNYPDSLILSTDTGHWRDYFRYPYGSYRSDERLVFPARGQAQLLAHPKAILSYIWETDSRTPSNRFSGASQFFLHEQLRQQGGTTLRFNGRPIRVRWDSHLETVIVKEMNGDPIIVSTAFAFVFPAFFGSEQP